MSAGSLPKKIRVSIFFDGKKMLEKSFDDFSEPIVFGRLPTIGVTLDFPFVSRKHCQIVMEQGQLFLQDLQSRNGIFVEGKLAEKYPIKDSFEFTLDKLSIQVHLQLTAEEEKPDVEATVVDQRPKVWDRVIAPLQNLNQTLNQSLKKSTKTKIPAQSLLNSSETMTHSHQSESHERPKLATKNFLPELIEAHPGLGSTAFKKLEAVVLWQDQVFEVREFDNTEKVTLGPSPLAALRVPVLKKNWSLAKVDFRESTCFIPKDKVFTITRNGEKYSSEDLVTSKQVRILPQGYSFKLSHQDIVDVDLGSGMKVVLRYIPGTPTLTRRKLTEPDEAIKQAFLGSLVAHGLLALAIIIAAPKPKNVPQIKDVPERFARLLVEPPQPILPVPETIKPPPPPPEPPKKEVVKKEPPKPPKKEVVKKLPPQPKRMELPKPLKQQNKLPLVVKNPPRVKNAPTVAQARTTSVVERPAPPVKVESLGALAALGPISNDPNPGPPSPNIQINKNAGGASSPVASTKGMIGALPAAGGKLVAAGNGPIKTGGSGIGSGTAYGTQGLGGGGAGTRGVAGAVVGAPKLAQSGKVEGLTRQQVMDVVQKHLGEIQHCYEKSLLADPKIAGRMEFEWDIQASGRVSQVRIKRSTVNGGDALGGCVKGVFSKMKFPTAKNGQSTTPNIGFPFGRL